MLNSTHNLTGLQLGDIGRGALTEFHTGSVLPEVQPRTVLYTSFNRKLPLSNPINLI